jgi:hypothetical protein
MKTVARSLLVAAPFVLALAFAAPARADILPEGQTMVPAVLTIDGLDAAKDASLVIAGCNPEGGGGRHFVGIAVAGQPPLRCRFKLPAEVYLVANSDLKPIQDLVAKDVGWGDEGVQARKLLAKSTLCGFMSESTLVERGTVKEIAVHYAFAKTSAGCSITKVAAAAKPETAPLAAASTPATASTPAAASATPPAAPPHKSGCTIAAGQGGASRGATFAAVALGLALASRVARRRRR